MVLFIVVMTVTPLHAFVSPFRPEIPLFSSPGLSNSLPPVTSPEKVSLNGRYVDRTYKNHVLFATTYKNTKLYASSKNTSKKRQPKKKTTDNTKSNRSINNKLNIKEDKDDLQLGNSNFSEEDQEAKVQALLDKRFKGLGT